MFKISKHSENKNHFYSSYPLLYVYYIMEMIKYCLNHNGVTRKDLQTVEGSAVKYGIRVDSTVHVNLETRASSVHV